MSPKVNDSRRSGRSKSLSAAVYSYSAIQPRAERYSLSPSSPLARRCTTRRSRETDSADENPLPKLHDIVTMNREGGERYTYDLSDSDEALWRKKHHRHNSDNNKQQKSQYRCDSDLSEGNKGGEERKGRPGSLPEYYYHTDRTTRTSLSHGRQSPLDGGNYSNDYESDSSFDEGLVYSHDHHLLPSLVPSSSRDAPDSHSNYDTTERYDPESNYYTRSAQYGAYTNPRHIADASENGPQNQTQAETSSKWAPISDSEVPSCVLSLRDQEQSIPGAFPSEVSPTQNRVNVSTTQHMKVPLPQQRPSLFDRRYKPPASAFSHPYTVSAEAGLYANLAPFQYAQIDPSIRYGFKSPPGTIQYAYSATPQFSKSPIETAGRPQTDNQQYVTVASEKRGSGYSHNLSAPPASEISVNVSDQKRRAMRPMLEPYGEVHHSIPSIPSSVIQASRRNKDVPHQELPTSSSNTYKWKGDRQGSREGKGRKGKTSQSEQDTASARHGKYDPADQKKVLLISPISSSKRMPLYDPEPDALKVRNALLHSSGVDAKVLINILPRLSSEDMLALRKEYKNHIKIQGKGLDVAKHVQLKLSGSTFGSACYALTLGRWESEAYWANCYYQPSKSRQELLIESLTGRSNTEIARIKDSFRDSRYTNSLEQCVRSELKAGKFRTAILLALEERRQSEHEEINMELVYDDVRELYRALASHEGNETVMIYIIVLRSNNHLREILRTYERRYQQNFARAMIAKSQSLVGETLAHILNGVINRPVRDAILMNQALRGRRSAKERSELLTSRLVRLHWEPIHLEKVKLEFHKRYGEQLEEAIAKELLKTSIGSDWGKLCVELVRSGASEP